MASLLLPFFSNIGPGHNLSEPLLHREPLGEVMPWGTASTVPSDHSPQVVDAALFAMQRRMVWFC